MADNQLSSDDIRWLEYFIYPAWNMSLGQVARKHIHKLLNLHLVTAHISDIRNDISFTITEDGHKVLMAYRNLKGE
jgi:hypothetical protein